MKTGVYTNFVGIKKDMTEAVNEALENTANEMLEKLKDFIIQDVYGAYHPVWYTDSGDIVNAFEVTKSGSVGGLGIRGQAKIEFNENNIFYAFDQNDGFTHGNPWEKLNPKTFMGILNGDIKQGDAFGFSEIERKPFWNDFLTWANANFKKIYSKNLAKSRAVRGIKPKI